MVNLLNADPGTYVFEYVVYPQYNCGEDDFDVLNYSPGYCDTTPSTSGFCNAESARVTVTVYPKNYAGEDTTGLTFCETDPTIASPLDLFTLLTANGIDDPIYQGSLGTWTDAMTGNIITNPMTLPQINNQQTFDLIYTTQQQMVVWIRQIYPLQCMKNTNQV